MTNGAIMNVEDDLSRAEKYADDDILAVLYRQHADIAQALERVSQSQGDERAANLTAATEFLTRHEQAEQQIVRPIVEAEQQGGEADERNAEEQQADQSLAVLSAMDVDSDDFEIQFAEFKTAVTEHAEAEQTHEFPIVEHACSEAARIELGRRFLKAQAD
jgi:hypothetical protein